MERRRSGETAREPHGGRTHYNAMNIWDHKIVYRKSGAEPLGGTSSRYHYMTFYIRRIWNIVKQFPEFCLPFGGITTGIQILRHVLKFRISNGLPLGTSSTDTWRLKPSTRCQFLVDLSELCNQCYFEFFSTHSRSVRAKKRKKEEKEKRKIVLT